MRVLTADDSAVIREQLRDVLGAAGYEVTAVADGKQAWEALRTGDFRLAILDWLMPGMTGPEICQKLQQQPDLRSVYAIILTSKSATDNLVEAISVGASDYVVKPFKKAELLARLNLAKRVVRLQVELAKSSRLASIGELGAGIAHEINTPLQYLGDNTHFLSEAFTSLCDVMLSYRRLHESLTDNNPNHELAASVEAACRGADIEFLLDEIPKSLQQSADGVHRMTSIVQAMKAFCHPGTNAKVLVDINSAIDTTITVARSTWKYVARMVTDFDADLPPVFCYGSEVSQVVLNLIVNAAHAIADSQGEDSSEMGAITIRTRQVDGFAEIRVTDTGTGIPEAVRHQLFDAFFTTKEAGKGTGQGLAIARSVVVDKHQGTIDFETEMGRGTTFIVRLPLSASDGTTREATLAPSVAYANG